MQRPWAAARADVPAFFMEIAENTADVPAFFAFRGGLVAGALAPPGLSLPTAITRQVDSRITAFESQLRMSKA